jgi:peroxiredoxin Q/BCP
MPEALQPGSQAPAFDLPSDGGGRVRLADLKGRWVVLYFYPKDDTTGCTKEAIEFTAAASEFEALNAVVVGVSRDTAHSHDRFKAKHQLAPVLGADVDGEMTERYGVWVEKSMYGRTYMGVERATFLIGPEGTIRRVWRKVKVAGHVAAVLESLRELNDG